MLYIDDIKSFICCYGPHDVQDRTFMIGISKDLINWDFTDVFINNFGDSQEVLAPDLFYENNKLYVIFSALDDDNRYLYLTYTEDLENFEAWNNPTKINLGLNYVIDGQIKKVDDEYLLICKKGTNENITDPIPIYSSNDLSTWSLKKNTVINGYAEAPNLIYYEGKYLINVDLFNDGGQAYCETTDLLATTYNWNINNLTANENGKHYQHGSILYVNDSNEDHIIKKLNISFSGDNSKNVISSYLILNGNYDTLVLLPNQIYDISGNTAITNLVNPFNLTNIPFRFVGNIGITLTITNFGNNLSNMTNRNLSVKNTSGTNEQIFYITPQNELNDRTTLPKLIESLDVSSSWQNPSNLTLNYALLSIHGNIGMLTINITATANISNAWYPSMLLLDSNRYSAILDGGGLAYSERRNMFMINGNSLNGAITLNNGETDTLRIMFIC